jgi:hypothetical protein
LIDLHAHTNESDGSVPPAELVGRAVAAGLGALAICDHDTLTGYDLAAPVARSAGLELVCGLELSTKLECPGVPKGRSIHLLGYFLDGAPPAWFREWLTGLQEARRDRNHRLVASLQSHGVDITLSEVGSIGRTLTGRPHFARLLLKKGYVSSLEEAFDVYLGESAETYVYRQAPTFQEAVKMVTDAGGLPSLAHPVRLLRRKPPLEDLIEGFVEAGLRGIEVYYSEHSPEETGLFLAMARHYRLAVTGGSDFHGETKPGIDLGTGINGNLAIPRELLDNLRAFAGS